MEPNIINVYAQQVTETERNHVTDQGFGYSSLLGHPETSTEYIWEGKLHGQRKDVVGNGNSRKSLDDLAQNLVYNIRHNQSPQHNQARIPAYSVKYEVEESTRKQGSSSIVTRPLTPSERMMFSGAFEKALKQ